MYDNLIIPNTTKKPTSFVKIDINTPSEHKPKTLKPLLLATTGLFGILASSMILLLRAAKQKTVLPSWKTLPEIPKNVAINSEPHFVTYLMLRDPNIRNVMGALGVFVLSAIGFAGKNFVDGVKEIWVRKKQADIQKELQEKLISVETQSFSGKMQILRNMLNEKAKELNTILNKPNINNEKMTFRKFISFKNSKNTNKKENSQIKNVIAVIGTAITATLLGLLAFRSLQKTAKTYEQYLLGMENKVRDLIQKQENCHKFLF